MTPWDKFFDEKIKTIARERRILDAGGGEPFSKELSKYRELFKDSDYVVFDINAEPSSGAIKGDIHELPFSNESFDALICKSVLEHVENPHKVIAELYRVLKPGGKGFLYVPFLFPYHAEKGFYKDYWRFTEDGVRELLKNFSKIEIQKLRGFFETLIHFLPYLRHVFIWPARILDYIFPSKNQTSGFHIFVIK